MSSTLIFGGLPTGLTITATTFLRGSDTAVESNVALTEATNLKTTYSGTFTTATSGFYTVLIKQSTTIIASSVVYAESTGTFYADQTDQVLNEATGSELASVPSAAPSLREMVAFLYQAVRNQATQSGSVQTVTNDAGTTVASATTTDNGSVFTKGKFA